MTTKAAQLEISPDGKIHAPEFVTLQGTINRVIFHNPQNGYTVLSIDLNSRTINVKENVDNIATSDDERITANDVKLTGHLSAPREGDEYRFTGQWTVHPRFGMQLKFSDAELILPVGKSGVARYLSQITAGVGVVKAEKIVAALGGNALTEIRDNPDAFTNHPDLSFLTDTQKTEIVADLTKNSVQAELAALICGPGTGMGTVMRIMAEFGQGAVAKVKENPYLLCDEVYGIGFKTADAIALRTGIERNSPFRLDAALLWVLSEAAQGEGHCHLRPNLIVERLIGKRGVLAGSGVEVADIAAANQRIIDNGRCVREGDAVYLKRLWVAERLVARKVGALVRRGQKFGEPDAGDILKGMLSDIESRDSVEYAIAQKDAVFRALHHPLSIITGGPGTGKTTVLKAIVEIYRRLHPSHDLYLCAPTGRAAKRMSEAIGGGHEAMTIHRMLRYNPMDNAFQYGANMPLPGPGLIIVDEASMIDMELAAALFGAVNAGRTDAKNDVSSAHQVVLVGDVDQLPSVGPGSVLRDLIDSGRVPTTCLEFNYRQAGGSRIAEAADRVRQGEMIALPTEGGAGGGNNVNIIGRGCAGNSSDDFKFFKADGGDEAGAAIKQLVEIIKINRHELSPLDWQVLLPMHRGSCGVKALNEAIREIVNPAKADRADDDDPGARPKTLGGFRVGDKVLVTKNNYSLEVFNGDLGIVRGIDKGSLTVDFGEGEGCVTFPFEMLDTLTLAYASTIHKAQGSEFKLVIMGLCSQHYVMLQRNLVYTAMTRARDELLLVGDTRSVAMAVKNNKIEERLSGLKGRIGGLKADVGIEEKAGR